MNRLASHLCRLFVIALIFGSSIDLMAERDRDKVLPPAPPQPVPQVIKVHRGGKAEIELHIYGSQKDELRFPIRTKPTSGKLSEPVAKGREAAVVTYEPPADLSVKGDRFTYASQGPGGVSAPAEVRIEIIDDPVDLQVPKAIEFPAMLAGGKASREFEISNRGGSLAEGLIEVDAPWSIEGSNRYHLTGGASQKFKLIFAPVHDGGFESDLRFSSQPDRSTPVTGRANAALALSVAQLDLRSQPGDAARSGAFDISNNTASDQQVTFSAGARLQLAKSVAVPANAHISVPVDIPAGDVALLQDEIRVSGAGVELRLPARAAAVPAVLHASTEPIQFPTGAPNQVLTMPLEVTNIGGMPGEWKWEITPPFEVAEAGGSVGVGEKKNITIRLRSSEPGRFRTWLKISGEQQSLEIPVEAVIATAMTSARSTGQPRAVGAVQPISQTTTERISDDRPAFRGGGGGPIVRRDIVISDITPSSAKISWPWSPSDPVKYRVEERSLSLDQNHQLKIDWFEHSAVTVQVSGNTIVAQLQKLAPGTLHAVRFLPVANDGTVGPWAFMSEFATLKKPSLFRVTTTRVWIVIALAMAGFLVWRFRQGR